MKNILTKLVFIIGLGAMLSGCATSTLWTNTNDLVAAMNLSMSSNSFFWVSLAYRCVIFTSL